MCIIVFLYGILKSTFAQVHAVVREFLVSEYFYTCSSVQIKFSKFFLCI